MKVRLLRGSDVRAVLSMGEAIDATRRALRSAHGGHVVMPARTQLHAEDGTSLFMPVHDPALRRSSVKVVSVFPGNVERGMDSISGLVMVLDATTGMPQAVIDGTVLTALRTGAASGVATDLLAPPDARTLALVGAGGQAPFQVRAVAHVRELVEVRISNRTTERAEALADLLSSELPDARVTVAASAEEALDGADIICTATSSPDPVIPARAVASTAHVNAIGSFTPEMRELPRDLLGRARGIYVDQRGAVLVEAGEIIDAVDAGVLAPEDLVEIGAVIDGPTPIGGRDGPTIFKSCGLAVQDLYVAARALDLAVAQGVGTTIEL